MARAVYDYKLKLLGKTNPETMYAQQILAWILGCEAADTENGDFRTAIALNRENLEAKTVVFGPRAPSTLVTMNNLILVLKDAGELDEALPLAKKALAAITETFGAGSLNYCRAVRCLADLYLERSKYALAHRVLSEGVREAGEYWGPDHPETLELMEIRAVLYFARGDFDKALPIYRQLFSAYRSKMDDDSEKVVTTVRNLTMCLFNTGAADEMFRLQYELANGPKASPEYECALGCLYKNGIGTKPDRHRALYWLQKALDHGFQEASGIIEEIRSS